MIRSEKTHPSLIASRIRSNTKRSAPTGRPRDQPNNSRNCRRKLLPRQFASDYWECQTSGGVRAASAIGGIFPLHVMCRGQYNAGRAEWYAILSKTPGSRLVGIFRRACRSHPRGAECLSSALRDERPRRNRTRAARAPHRAGRQSARSHLPLPDDDCTGSTVRRRADVLPHHGVRERGSGMAPECSPCRRTRLARGPLLRHPAAHVGGTLFLRRASNRADRGLCPRLFRRVRGGWPWEVGGTL